MDEETQVDDLLEKAWLSLVTPVTVGSINEVYGFCRKALIDLGKPAIPALIRNLTNEISEKREISASTLGVLGDQSAVEPLIDLLLSKLKVHKNLAPAMSAAISLGSIGDIRAINPLIEAVKLYSGPGWGAFLNSLGRLGEPAKQAVIRAGQQEDDQELRKAAIEIADWYVEWGGCERDASMLTLASKHYIDYRVLRHIERLEKLRDINTLPVLITLAEQSQNQAVIKAATKAIEYINKFGNKKKREPKHKNLCEKR